MRTRKARQRERTPSRATRVLITPPPRRPYPRGNPLTDSVTVTDGAGIAWLAYVEPAPSETPLRRSATVLPGRRLRFDSADVSLIVSPIPAGSPFLTEDRLRALLGRAEPIPRPEPPPARRIPVRTLWSVDWGESLSAAVGAVRDAGARQWRATAGLRQVGARALVQAIAPAVLLLIVVWESVLVRPRARI